jgi:hypothetical protein
LVTPVCVVVALMEAPTPPPTVIVEVVPPGEPLKSKLPATPPEWPMLKIVFMEWSPFYVRGMGVMGLMVVLVALVDFLRQNSK